MYNVNFDDIALIVGRLYLETHLTIKHLTERVRVLEEATAKGSDTAPQRKVKTA